MKRMPAPTTTKNPPERFAGDVWLDILVTPQHDDQRTVVGLVRFAPGSRTAWHSHVRGQFLHVVGGAGLTGTRDGEVLTLHEGDTVYCPPGQAHWHGAGPDTFMEHLAISENADDPSTSTTWLEHVSDDAYAASLARAT